MSKRKPSSSRYSPDHASNAGAEEGRLSDAATPALVAAASSAEREGPPTEARPLEITQILQALRDEVRALGQRLDGLSAPAPEPAPSAPREADEPSAAAAPEPSTSSAASRVAEGVEPPGNRSAQLPSVRCRLRELSVLAPDSSRPTRVLPAQKPFALQLDLEFSADSSYVAFPLLSEATVRARRLGGGKTNIVGEASQSITSAPGAAALRCEGLPLPAGLYRFEATAAVRGSQDTRPRGVAFLDGGLIRVV